MRRLPVSKRFLERFVNFMFNKNQFAEKTKMSEMNSWELWKPDQTTVRADEAELTN